MDEEAAQVQGCGETPGDRDMEPSLHCQRANGWYKTLKTRSPVLTGMRLLYFMLVVMMTALLPRYYRRDGSEKAEPSPRLASKAPDEQQEGGLTEGSPAHSLTYSQSHCRAGYQHGCLQTHWLTSVFRLRPQYRFTKMRHKKIFNVNSL